MSIITKKKKGGGLIELLSGPRIPYCLDTLEYRAVI
jgi:hypothetical protein